MTRTLTDEMVENMSDDPRLRVAIGWLTRPLYMPEAAVMVAPKLLAELDAVDPLRRPVDGDAVEAGRIAYHDWCREHDKRDPWPYTKAIEACIAAAGRARGFAAIYSPKAGTGEEVAWDAFVRAAIQWAEHMDQWEKFQFGTEHGQVYVKITRQTTDPGSYDHVMPSDYIGAPERRSDSAPRDAAPDITTHESPGVAALAKGTEKPPAE